jgi:hypothetical protein
MNMQLMEIMVLNSNRQVELNYLKETIMVLLTQVEMDPKVQRTLRLLEATARMLLTYLNALLTVNSLPIRVRSV